MRKDMHKEHACGDFRGIGQIIGEQAAEYTNISVIHGFEFVPQDETLFADLALHPNDQGFVYYIEHLWKGIKEKLHK